MKYIIFILMLFNILSCSHAQIITDSSAEMSPLPTPNTTREVSGQLVGNRFKRVIYIVFENEDYTPVIKNQIYKKYADKGARFDNFFASIHPSQGNYLAMTAGSNYNVNHDQNITLDVPHIGDLIERKNLDWMAYAEDYPGNCFLGAQRGSYVRKHTPFLSYKNIQASATRCNNRIVNFSNFFQDWKNNKLPAFSFIVPNLKNDGHDTNIDYSGKWLSQNFDSMFNNPQMMKDTLVILTYDEGSYLSNNRIYTVIFGPSVKPGSVVSVSHNHGSLLKLIEDEWNLGDLGKLDRTAAPIDGIWQ